MFSQACVQVPADEADEYVKFCFTPDLLELALRIGQVMC
jgi:hypothetical protein